jgi:uncharacterized protein
MNRNEVINNTVAYVKKTLENSEKGHDWWHIYRVWKISKLLAKTEKADLFIVQLSALLHDIADWKFNNGDEALGPKMASEFLTKEGLSKEIIDKVVYIIRNISYKGSAHKSNSNLIELNIVQDADRLDAMGAIGIARCFNYGGFSNREIYNPNIPPVLNMNKDQYKTNIGTSLNHFYEKLLLLKTLMNTKTGRSLAKERHAFMLKYLKQFYREWEGKI